MSPEPRWVSKKALLLLHEESLSQFGGQRGLRDEGLLDSALARPRNLLSYSTRSDIFDLAASYAFGLIKNHAFIDGNKRAAFLSVGIFLYINGYKLVADKIEAIQVVLSLASGEVDENIMASWIRKNSVPLIHKEKE